MADMATIREGLATQLATVTGLQTSAYRLVSPSPPVCHVYPAEPAAEYDIAIRTDRHFFVAEVLLQNPSDRGAQRKLDEYIGRGGVRSIKTNLEKRDVDQRILGGACDDLVVTGVNGYGEYSITGGGSSLGARFRIEVYVTTAS